MPSQKKLLRYIKESQDNGLEREETIRQLIEAGWDKESIDQVFRELDKVPEKNIFKKTAALAFFFMVIVVTGFAFSYFFTGVSPEREIIRAASRTVNSDLLKSETRINFSYGQGREIFNGDISILTEVDNIGNQRDSTWDATMGVEGMRASFSGRIFTVKNKTFGRVDRFFDSGFFFPTILEDLTERDILLAYTPEKEGSFESFFSQNFELFLIEEIDRELMENIMSDFLRGVVEKDIVFVKESEIDEIKGGRVNKHQVGIDFKGLPDLILDLTEKYENKIERLTTAQMESALEEWESNLEKMIEDFEESDFSALIWSDHNYLHKVEIDFGRNEAERYFQIFISIEFSELDSSLNLNVPEEYIDLQNLLDSLYKPDIEERSLSTEMQTGLEELELLILEAENVINERSELIEPAKRDHLLGEYTELLLRHSYLEQQYYRGEMNEEEFIKNIVEMKGKTTRLIEELNDF